ncbi:MAG: YqaA family protein [Planctomycetota bacterium]
MFGSRLALAAAGDAGFFSRCAAWMEGFAASPHSTAWLFVFAFAESSFFPIPPDTLLIALCLTQAANASLAATMWFALVCTAASALGGAFGYLVGMKAGRPILRRVARAQTIDNAERLLQRYDVWAVGAAGFTPIPYKIFTIASGMLRVKFVRFFAVSVASRGARFFLVAALCYATAEEVNYYLKHHLGWAMIALLALLVGGFWVLKAVGRRVATSEGQEEGAAGPGASAPDVGPARDAGPGASAPDVAPSSGIGQAGDPGSEPSTISPPGGDPPDPG